MKAIVSQSLSKQKTEMMKNLKNTLFLLIILLTINSVEAQNAEKLSDVSKTPAAQNINGQLIDPGTNCVLRYYYFPNLEAYYDTQKNIYHFIEGGQWVTKNEIPAGYRGYSLYNKVNVIIKDYDDEDPTQFIRVHKKRYPYITKGAIKKMVGSLE